MPAVFILWKITALLWIIQINFCPLFVFSKDCFASLDRGRQVWPLNYLIFIAFFFFFFFFCAYGVGQSSRKQSIFSQIPRMVLQILFSVLCFLCCCNSLEQGQITISFALVILFPITSISLKMINKLITTSWLMVFILVKNFRVKTINSCMGTCPIYSCSPLYPWESQCYYSKPTCSSVAVSAQEVLLLVQFQSYGASSRDCFCLSDFSSFFSQSSAWRMNFALRH